MRQKYTDEICRGIALQCSSLLEFRKLNRSAETVARKNGWLKNYTWLTKKYTPTVWTDEMIIAEAKKYATMVDFIKGCKHAYDAAYKRGLLSSFDWLKSKCSNPRKPQHTISYENCIQLARSCTTLTEFRLKYPSESSKAYKYGWIKDFHWLERTDRRKPNNL